MSPIENLPHEILEMIFLECLNPNLPRASPRIATALSTFRTKMALVKKAFSGHVTCNNELCFEDSCFLQTAETYQTASFIGKLQSDILSCRWMTWDFLQIYMERFIVNAITHVFRTENLEWQDSVPVEDSVVRSFVHENLYRNAGAEIVSWDAQQLDGDPLCIQDFWDEHYLEFDEDIKIFLTPQRSRAEAGDVTTGNQEGPATKYTKYTNVHRAREYLWVVFGNGDEKLGRVGWSQRRIKTSSLVVRSWTSTDAESEIAVGITPGTGAVIIGSCSRSIYNGDWAFGFLARRRSLACYRDTCEIPEKILKGPWTRDKLHFLEAVLEAGGCVINEERVEAARHGLMDAIHRDDYRAVDLIASESVDALQTQFIDTGGVYVEPSYTDVDISFVRNQDFCPSVSGTRPRRTVDISPTTEHLKAAVLERGCRRMIVGRLLFARSDQIDRRDRAIVAWIKEKTKRGDEKGKWLRNQLGRSAYLQSLTREELVQELYIRPGDED